MQKVLTAGDSLDFETSVSGYPPSDGWTLKFRLVPIDAGNAAIEWTATTSGDAYRSQVSPTTSGAWDAGVYGWTSWLEKSGARHTVETGHLTILADPETAAAGTDNRSHARKVLAQIETALEGWATTGSHIAEYEIAGRRMKYADRADVIAMRSRYKAEVWREDAAQAIAEGLPNPRNIGVRFARA